MKKSKIEIILFVSIFLVMFTFICTHYYIKGDNKNTKKDNYTKDQNTFIEIKEDLAEQAKQLCFKNPVAKEDLGEDFNNKVNELNKLFSNNKLNISYYYYDLRSGFSLSYNADAQSWAASVIKAPVAVYVYTLASRGEINLDEELTYTPSFYTNGTGVIQKKAYYTKYTIRTLVEYAIKYSDNIAHRMLVNKFGMDNIREFWRNLGSTTIFENNQIFSNFNAKDGYIVMKELYEFARFDDYGKELLEYFKAAKPNFVVGSDTDEIAHKYGWGQNSLHDMAIVLDENPYILVVFTNRGYTEYGSFFKDVSKKVNDIHKEYNNYKNNYCNNLE